MHHLAAAASVARGAEDESALSEWSIQDLPIHHVRCVGHVHPQVVVGFALRGIWIAVGEKSPVEAGRIHGCPLCERRGVEVTEVDFRGVDLDVGLARPTGWQLTFRNRIEVLEHQRRGQFDVPVVGHLKRIGDVEGLGRDAGVREGQHIDVRRGGSQQHCVGEAYRGLLGGAGHDGCHSFAVQRQSDRCQCDSVGQFGPVRGVRRHFGCLGNRARGDHARPTDGRHGHRDGLTGEDRVSVVLQQVGAVLAGGGEAVLEGDQTVGLACGARLSSIHVVPKGRAGRARGHAFGIEADPILRVRGTVGEPDVDGLPGGVPVSGGADRRCRRIDDIEGDVGHHRVAVVDHEVGGPDAGEVESRAEGHAAFLESGPGSACAVDVVPKGRAGRARGHAFRIDADPVIGIAGTSVEGDRDSLAGEVVLQAGDDGLRREGLAAE